ncbi:MAG: hypothetical protein KJ926_07545 [Candidatus Omnitrophica bacterium]|nr:hypothetical protein [Candidatus Omnitrophota bacterium]
MKSKTRFTVIIIFISLCMAPLVFSQEVEQKEREKHIRPPDAYNRGVDFYGRGDYNNSAESFVKALNTDNSRLEQWTSYNLGNSNYNRAQAQEQANPQAALGGYRDALEFFRRALNIDAYDNNAKYNYELTAQKIKLLEEKMEKQENQDKQQQNEQENKEQKPDSQSGQNQSQQQPEQEKEQPAAAKTKDGSESRAKENKDMTEEEALNLLNRLEQSEIEQKQLILKENQRQEPEVEKDW